MTKPARYSIERIAPSAASYFRRLSPKTQQRIKQAYKHLCDVSPFLHTNPTVITPLTGKKKGLWRYRLGDIRIIYSIDKEKRAITIVAIDSRGDAYG